MYVDVSKDVLVCVDRGTGWRSLKRLRLWETKDIPSPLTVCAVSQVLPVLSVFLNQILAHVLVLHCYSLLLSCTASRRCQRNC